MRSPVRIDLSASKGRMDEKQLNKIQKILYLNKGIPLVDRALGEVEMAKLSAKKMLS